MERYRERPLGKPSCRNLFGGWHGRTYPASRWPGVRMTARTAILALALLMVVHTPGASREYQKRVETVRRIPGLVAFWDFVLRDGDDFLAHTVKGDPHRYMLEPRNIACDYWHGGPEATMADFPLLNRGPFGQAVRFQSPTPRNYLPVLLVPRAKLHGTPLDIKGPGQSVSMVAWLVYQHANHAIAGIWHEGTDIPPASDPPAVVERGRRQYALFGGLGANSGGASAHVSENGRASFGDRYARNLAVTPETMKRVGADASVEEIDAGWSVVGFSFDNARDRVTAYLNGRATEYWIDNPAGHPFYQHPARGWLQAKLAKMPGLQPGEDPAFPKDQYYEPPETKPRRERVIARTAREKMVERTCQFTKVRLTLRRDPRGRWVPAEPPVLVALKVNPYWFGHDLYAPATESEGGPFTVGRVIHSNRHAIALSAYYGGVAVFNRVLTPGEMERLAQIGRPLSSRRGIPAVIPHP